MHEPVEDFPYKLYLDELRAMERPYKSPSDLEARIMLLVGSRSRPKRVRLLMQTLRDQRHASGELHRFEAFEAILTNHLGTDFVIGHDFAPETFSSMDHDLVRSNVGRVIEELQKVSRGVFLNSGTLLGVIRDGKLLDHDDDIDIGICLHATTEENAAAEWVALRRLLSDLGVFKEEGTSPLIYKLKSEGGYQIDLFPCWVQEGRVCVFPHTYGQLAERDIFPTGICEVTGFPVPARPEKMLAVNYGENWKTPDPYFRFDWRSARANFRTMRHETESMFAREAETGKAFGTILTYGTFDLFHVGHLRTLRRLSDLCDRLIVGCTTDDYNAARGKRTINGYAERAEMLNACGYVSDVFPLAKPGREGKHIRRYKADLMAVGCGTDISIGSACRLLYLPRIDDVSTAVLKARIIERQAVISDLAAE